MVCKSGVVQIENGGKKSMPSKSIILQTSTYNSHIHKRFQRYEFLSSDFWSSLNFGQVTDRQTDIQKAMHMSPPCISTGVLNESILYN